MGFRIVFIPSAKKDLEETIEYYFNIYQSLSQKFYIEFESLIQSLESNPFYEIKYSNVRSRHLKSFPYCVHFIVDEGKSLVSIIAITFSKQERTNFQSRIE